MNCARGAKYVRAMLNRTTDGSCLDRFVRLRTFAVPLAALAMLLAMKPAMSQSASSGSTANSVILKGGISETRVLNLRLDTLLALEENRYEDENVHFDENRRHEDRDHQRTLRSIGENDRILDKADAIARENDRHALTLRNIERARRLAEAEHARRVAEIQTGRTAPGGDELNVGSLDARQQAHALAAEESRHDRVVSHLDDNDRVLDRMHERRLRSIGSNARIPEDEKAVEEEDENARYTAAKHKLQRQRNLAEEEHALRKAAIERARASAQGVPPGQLSTGTAETDRGAIQSDKTAVAGTAGGIPAASGEITPTPAPSDVSGGSTVGPTMTHPLPGAIAENEAGALGTGGTADSPLGQNSVANSPLSQPSPDLRQQLMNDAAALDRAVTAWQDKALSAGNHFFEGMGEVISAQLRFMAQDPGEPTKQIAQAVIKFLTTDYNRNNAQLYDDAVAAVDEFQKDPARFFGQQAGGALVSAATEGAGRLVAGGVTAGAAQAVKRTKEVVAAQKAARQLREIERMAELPGNAPVCVPLEDCFWRAMRNSTGDPAYETKFNSPRPTSWAEVHNELAKNFGGKVNGVPFPAAHALGIPDAMPLPQVMKELEKSGPGSEGIVIVKTASGNVHAFNAANLKGQVVLVDDQKQFWGGGAERMTVEQTLGPIVWSLFYRTR